MTMTAAEACADYERWASEVSRLTAAIAEMKCPNEWDYYSDDPPPADPGVSCFTEVKSKVVPGRLPDDGPRPPFLSEIATAVADCPQCSELVDLIRARRHAKKRYGVAKHRIRSIGKVALKEVAAE